MTSRTYEIDKVLDPSFEEATKLADQYHAMASGAAFVERKPMCMYDAIAESMGMYDALVEPVGTYEAIAKTVGTLVDKKNAVYGDAFGKSGQFLTLLYPNGIPVEKYSDALCIIRIFDKLMRLATQKDALGESPYQDIAGYALLGIKMSTLGENGKQESEQDQRCGDDNGASHDD